MVYSGPATFSELEDDLALSEEEEQADNNWPHLPRSAGTRPSTATVVPGPPLTPRTDCDSQAASSSKRPMDDVLNSSGEPQSPASKVSRQREGNVPQGSNTMRSPQLRPSSVPPPHMLLTPPSLPAFAPRDEYMKLMFEGNPSVDVKLRWLAEVNRTYHLDRFLAEVKMSAVTSRFVYISRKRLDIVKSAECGEFLALKLSIQDSPDRPRKLPTYLITRYPVGVDPSLSKEMDGVYSARRFHQDGKPINRIVVTWTLPDPPPSSVAFSFLPCLPPCELRKIENDRPSCYRCWGIGHISRYCSAPEKCAWCAGGHDSRTCPHRAPPPPPPDAEASTSRPPPPTADVTSNWRCPRCKEPGVSVWHGCTRRQATVASTPSPLPQLLPQPGVATPLVPTPVAPSPQVLALRSAVEKLMTRCASLESRLDTIETRITSLATSQANTEATLATLVETQQAVISAVTSLTEKLDAFVSRYDGLNDRPAPSDKAPRFVASSSPGSRSSKKHTVR